MTPEQAEDAARLYVEAGLSLREVGAVYGTDGKTVWRAIRRLVKTRRTGPRGRTDVPDSVIVDLRDADASWAEIAAATGMSRSGVRKRYDRAAKNRSEQCDPT